MSPRRPALNADRLHRRSAMDRYLEPLERPADTASAIEEPLPPAAEPSAAVVIDEGADEAVGDIGAFTAAPARQHRPRRTRAADAGEETRPATPPSTEGVAEPAAVSRAAEQEPDSTAPPVEERLVLLNTELTPAAIKALHAAAWSDGRDGDKSPLVRAAIEAALDEFELLRGEPREAAVARLRRRNLEPRVVRVYRVTRAIRDRLIAINRDEAVPLRALPRDAVEHRYGGGESEPEQEASVGPFGVAKRRLGASRSVPR